MSLKKPLSIAIDRNDSLLNDRNVQHFVGIDKIATFYISSYSSILAGHGIISQYAISFCFIVIKFLSNLLAGGSVFY